MGFETTLKAKKTYLSVYLKMFIMLDSSQNDYGNRVYGSIGSKPCPGSRRPLKK